MIILVFFCFSKVAFTLPWKGVELGKTYEATLIEDFEDQIRWDVVTKAKIQSYVKLVADDPLEAKKKNVSILSANSLATNLQSKKSENIKLYRQDLSTIKKSALIFNQPAPKAPLYSQELHCFFSSPGQEKVIITLPSVHRYMGILKGRPVAIALWVYGQSKRHVLYAVFSNNQKEYKFKISDLQFKGWTRLEKAIPTYLQNRNPQFSNKNYYSFKGLEIRSHASEQPGLFLFRFDLVSILVDRRKGDYPGSKINELNW